MLAPIPTPARSAAEPDEPRSVALVAWPSGATERARAKVAGRPCLLLVGDGDPPPCDCGAHEDWVRSSAAPDEVAARLATLAARAPRPHLVDAALAADLPPAEVRLLATVDARPGRVTPRARLLAALGTDEAAEVDDVVGRLRRALRPAGIEVLPVDGGIVLATLHPPA